MSKFLVKESDLLISSPLLWNMLMAGQRENHRLLVNGTRIRDTPLLTLAF